MSYGCNHILYTILQEDKKAGYPVKNAASMTFLISHASYSKHQWPHYEVREDTVALLLVQNSIWHMVLRILKKTGSQTTGLIGLKILIESGLTVFKCNTKDFWYLKSEPRKHTILHRNRENFSEASYFFTNKFFSFWSFLFRKGAYLVLTYFL